MAEEIITSTNVETATDHEYNASEIQVLKGCLLYTSPSPRDVEESRMPSSA